MVVVYSYGFLVVTCLNNIGHVCFSSSGVLIITTARNSTKQHGDVQCTQSVFMHVHMPRICKRSISIAVARSRNQHSGFEMATASYCERARPASEAPS